MKQSQISAHQQAYDAVLNNPYWYSDQPNLLKETFNAENTSRRAEITVGILRRAAKRKSERHLSEQYLRLVDKLSNCRKHHPQRASSAYGHSNKRRRWPIAD
jgi:hypothetical protein